MKVKTRNIVLDAVQVRKWTQLGLNPATGEIDIVVEYHDNGFTVINNGKRLSVLNYGDWVLTLESGERMFCRDEVFSKLFEPAGPDVVRKLKERLTDVLEKAADGQISSSHAVKEYENISFLIMRAKDE